MTTRAAGAIFAAMGGGGAPGTWGRQASSGAAFVPMITNRFSKSVPRDVLNFQMNSLRKRSKRCRTGASLSYVSRHATEIHSRRNPARRRLRSTFRKLHDDETRAGRLGIWPVDETATSWSGRQANAGGAHVRSPLRGLGEATCASVLVALVLSIVLVACAQVSTDRSRRLFHRLTPIAVDVDRGPTSPLSSTAIRRRRCSSPRRPR